MPGSSRGLDARERLWEIQESPTPGYHSIEANEKGIPGGIGTSRDSVGPVTFYVEVDDLQEHLSLAEALEGKVGFGHHDWASTGGSFASVGYSWAWYLASLKDYVETGEGRPGQLFANRARAKLTRHRAVVAEEA